MVNLVARKASAFDFLQVIDITGRAWVRTRRVFGLMSLQLAQSESLAIVTDETPPRLVAIGGLHEDESTPGAEAWFATGPALRPHLIGALRILALALELVAREAPGVRVTAYIDPRSVAGDRLAAMLGFEDVGVTAHAAGPLRTFRRVL